MPPKQAIHRADPTQDLPASIVNGIVLTTCTRVVAIESHMKASAACANIVILECILKHRCITYLCVNSTLSQQGIVELLHTNIELFSAFSAIFSSTDMLTRLSLSNALLFSANNQTFSITLESRPNNQTFYSSRPNNQVFYYSRPNNPNNQTFYYSRPNKSKQIKRVRIPLY